MDSYGVKIEDYFTTGKIENIYAINDTNLNSIYENEIIKAVGQGVAIWLYNNEFDSTDDAMTHGTEEQIAELKKLYRPVYRQITQTVHQATI